MMRRRLPVVLAALLWAAHAPIPLHAQDPRPMDYADLFRQAAIGDVALSPDGTRVLYRVSPTSFPEQNRDARIHVVRTDGTGDRALTDGVGGADRDPRWHPRGHLVGFTSVRNDNGRQLFLVRPDGGEPRQVTDVRGGIVDWGWSHDGRSLAYLAGRGADRQLWIMDGEGTGEARQLTVHPTPIDSFRWRKGSAEILFVAPDGWDEAEFRRRRAGFQARPIQRGLAFDDFLTLHPANLWRVSATDGTARRVTAGDLVVHDFRDSPGGDVVAVVAGPVDPHMDTRSREVYLVDPARGAMERLTHNHVPESIVGFSPDGSRLAISAPKDFAGRGINDIFVRPMDGGDWVAVTAQFDGEVGETAWSADGGSLYFIGRQGVNRQAFRVDVRDSHVRQLSGLTGVLSILESDGRDRVVFGFTDPRSPMDLYAARWDELGEPGRWARLTTANPWVEEIELARTETVRWTSDDGTEVEGLLVYPLDYDPARRYPLITEIHGGPASAFENRFLPTARGPHRAYGHLLAARGYALFLPNYRGSSNYGDHFRSQIVGDYWTRATEDIHTGIDHLIERGVAHPDSLGMMGWSAGGHWSNWMLVTTDRFRAIATGAGVTNWISLYGQTDNQASREYYLGRDPALDADNKPWHDFDHWWAESPLRYIANATTPTLIHFPEDDRRVPMPQGQELHMALKGLGVPTEFLVYPGEGHALREPRNQLVKLLADLGWFERWIRGAESWLDWAYVLEVAEEIETALEAEPALAAP